MKTQTTINTLKFLVNRLNELTQSPLEPYTQNEAGRMKANIGNHHLSQAYGGVCVHRMANDGGGVTTPIWHCHIPKKDAESQLRAYIRGIELVKES